MNARNSLGCVVVATSVVALTYGLGTVRASVAPPPQPLYYAGALEEDSTPVDGTRSLEVTLWKSADSVNAADRVCVTSAPDTTIDRGRFRVALSNSAPSDCVSALKNQPDLWAQLEVKDGPRPTTLPRAKVGAVPFAVEATRASEASGSLAQAIAELQTRVGKLESDSSGKLAGAWTATPAGLASIKDSDAWVDVPGVSVDFTVTKPVQIAASYSINAQPTPSAPTQFLGVRLVVDGRPIASSGSHFQPFAEKDANVNLNGQHLTDLSAARHVVKLQWRTFGTGPTWENNSAWGDGLIGGRTLIVTAFYK
jgi:hypothetical protein